MVRLAKTAVVALALAWAGPAFAETAMERSKQAFDDARRRIDAGDCAAAIPKLHESLRAFPSVGAHLSLAQCEEPTNPTSAWWALKRAEALALSTSDGRAEVARARSAALAPSVAMVELRVVGAARDLGGELRVDGDAVDRSLTDGPFAVGSGPHVIERTVPGKRPWSAEVVARRGQLVVLEATLVDEVPVATRVPAPSSARLDSTGRSWVGPLVLGALGVAATGGAIGFAVAGVSDRDRLRDTCGLSCRRADIDGARLELAAADVLGVVAIVAIGGAVLWWLVSPTTRARAPNAALVHF